eukprot:754283-Hanusia_phi.AAC.1
MLKPPWATTEDGEEEEKGRRRVRRTEHERQIRDEDETKPRSLATGRAAEGSRGHAGVDRSSGRGRGASKRIEKEGRSAPPWALHDERHKGDDRPASKPPGGSPMMTQDALRDSQPSLSAGWKRPKTIAPPWAVGGGQELLVSSPEPGRKVSFLVSGPAYFDINDPPSNISSSSSAEGDAASLRRSAADRSSNGRRSGGREHEEAEREVIVETSQRRHEGRDLPIERPEELHVPSTRGQVSGGGGDRRDGQEQHKLSDERSKPEEEEKEEEGEEEEEEVHAKERVQSVCSDETATESHDSSKNVRLEPSPISSQVAATSSSGWSIKELLARAQEEDVDAMFNLGVCYEEGRGVNANPMLACWWYSKAAELGDADAMFNVGVCLHEGIGTKRDEQRALLMWRKAAKLGNEDAAFIIGNMEESLPVKEVASFESMYAAKQDDDHRSEKDHSDGE